MTASAMLGKKTVGSHGIAPNFLITRRFKLDYFPGARRLIQPQRS